MPPVSPPRRSERSIAATPPGPCPRRVAGLPASDRRARSTARGVTERSRRRSCGLGERAVHPGSYRVRDTCTGGEDREMLFPRDDAHPAATKERTEPRDAADETHGVELSIEEKHGFV